MQNVPANELFNHPKLHEIINSKIFQIRIPGGSRVWKLVLTRYRISIILDLIFRGSVE